MKKNFLSLTFMSLWLFGTAQTRPAIEWASIPAGTFNMGRPKSEVARRDRETQHQVALTSTVFAQKMPDLVVKEIERPDWDNGSRIFVTIQNIGKAPSKPVRLKVYDVDITVNEAKELGVEKDKLWIFEENMERAEGNANDYDTDFEVKKEIPALNIGQTIRVEVFVEHWVYDSNCEIGAFVDCDNTIKEKNENNNKSYFFEGG